MQIGGRLAWLALPPAEAPGPVQGEAIHRLGRELGLDVTLFAPDGEQIAASGVPAVVCRAERSAISFRAHVRAWPGSLVGARTSDLHRSAPSGIADLGGNLFAVPPVVTNFELP